MQTHWAANKQAQTEVDLIFQNRFELLKSKIENETFPSSRNCGKLKTDRLAYGE
jgi:hypothetical protein